MRKNHQKISWWTRKTRLLVHLNPFWLVRAEVQRTVHCPKGSLSLKVQTIQQKRQQALKAYCPNMNTVNLDEFSSPFSNHFWQLEKREMLVVVRKAPQSCNIIPILKKLKWFKMWIGLNQATELYLSKRNQSPSNK